MKFYKYKRGPNTKQTNTSKSYASEILESHPYKNETFPYNLGWTDLSFSNFFANDQNPDGTVNQAGMADWTSYQRNAG
jgi:hypothetical protein